MRAKTIWIVLNSQSNQKEKFAQFKKVWTQGDQTCVNSSMPNSVPRSRRLPHKKNNVFKNAKNLRKQSKYFNVFVSFGNFHELEQFDSLFKKN